MSNISKTYTLLTSATDPCSSIPTAVKNHVQREGTLYLPLGEQGRFDQAARLHLLRLDPDLKDYTCCGFTYSKPDATFFFKRNDMAYDAPGAWRLSSHHIWTNMEQSVADEIPLSCDFGRNSLESAVLRSYSSGDSTRKVSHLRLRDWISKVTVIEPKHTLISDILDASRGPEGAVFAVGSGESAEWEVFRFVDASLPSSG